MIARIYDKNHVSLSTYIKFSGDKTFEQIKQWFYDNYRNAIEDIDHFIMIDTTKRIHYTYSCRGELLKEEKIEI